MSLWKLKGIARLVYERPCSIEIQMKPLIMLIYALTFHDTTGSILVRIGQLQIFPNWVGAVVLINVIHILFSLLLVPFILACHTVDLVSSSAWSCDFTRLWIGPLPIINSVFCLSQYWPLNRVQPQSVVWLLILVGVSKVHMWKYSAVEQLLFTAVYFAPLAGTFPATNRNGDFSCKTFREILLALQVLCQERGGHYPYMLASTECGHFTSHFAAGDCKLQPSG